ncbi:MAG TPA: polysaccharide biosynthesis/export family protein [Candidatus Sulfotelmatobacter sp.]|nr:polysaccharide biosynthesis/export family protein [Candidatus Sulfotelmatobacter sp.]
MKITPRHFLTALMAAATLTFAGCATPPPPSTAAMPPPVITLREGDTIKISFPGSANLDTTQQIRRDGKINLQLVGEVDAAGLTPDDLQKKLIDLYAPQISSKEVTVSLLSSTFPVFVNGEVAHPGKIMSDHPMTALEAVMEAGGFNPDTANMKAVKVNRIEAGKYKSYELNLKDILDGKTSAPFYLKPNDIVYVPERFQLF